MNATAASEHELLVLQLLSERPDGYTQFGIAKRLHLAGSSKGDPLSTLQSLEGADLVERYRTPLAVGDSWRPTVVGLQLLSDRGLIPELKPRRVCTCGKPFERIDTVLTGSRRCEQRASCPNGHVSYRWIDTDEAWRSGPGADEYGPTLIARLLRNQSWDEDPVLYEADRSARILLKPSFDPEGMITATQREGATTIRVDAFTESLWHELNAPTEDAARDVVEAVKPWRAEIVLDKTRAVEFWQTLDYALATVSIRRDAAVGGIDGMTIHCLALRGAQGTKYKAWSPHPGSPEGKFVRAMLDGARQIEGDAVRTWLEAVSSYIPPDDRRAGRSLLGWLRSRPLRQAGNFRELRHGDPAGPSLHTAPRGLPDRAEVAKYLADGTLLVAATGVVYDVLSPERDEPIGAPHMLTDGDWVWPADFAYYVRTYGVAPPDEFLATIRSDGYRAPQLTNEEVRELAWPPSADDEPEPGA